MFTIDNDSKNFLQDRLEDNQAVRVSVEAAPTLGWLWMSQKKATRNMTLTVSPLSLIHLH
jgi:hypothetical protein